jgi:hypothetical protein
MNCNTAVRTVFADAGFGGRLNVRTHRADGGIRLIKGAAFRNGSGDTVQDRVTHAQFQFLILRTVRFGNHVQTEDIVINPVFPGNGQDGQNSGSGQNGHGQTNQKTHKKLLSGRMK